MDASTSARTPDHPTSPGTTVLRRPGDELAMPIPGDPLAVRHARMVAAAALAELVDDEQRRNDVMVVLSELVTNSIQHGAPPRSLRLRVDPTGLEMEIEDGSPWMPVHHEPAGDGGGHGLHLIDALADGWGADPTDNGKRVWCRMRAKMRG